MSNGKHSEKWWREFERDLDKAIEADRATTEKERLAWLNTLPETPPELTGDNVQVYFFGPKKKSMAKPRNKKKAKKRKKC